MRPDWKAVEVGDALYEEGVEKWAADAYGHDPATVYVGPDNHVAPTYWTITRSPDANQLGARFIATRA